LELEPDESTRRVKSFTSVVAAVDLGEPVTTIGH